MAFETAKIGTNLRTLDATATIFGAYDIPDNNTAGMNLFIFGRDTAGNSSFWFVQAAAKRVNGGTAALVGTPQSTKLADSGASTWTAVVGVANNAFTITVTGAAGVTIDWGVWGFDIYCGVVNN